MTPDDYLGPEAVSRLVIDAMLTASGWVVQDFKKIALGVVRGVAVGLPAVAVLNFFGLKSRVDAATVRIYPGGSSL
jgi:hypothetical protein